MRLDLEELTDLFAFADKALGDASEEGLHIASHAVKTLSKLEEAGGMSLAKLLHSVNFAWDRFNVDETFEQWATRETQKHKKTIQERVCTWEFLDQYVPGEHKEAFLNNWNVSMYAVGYRVAVKHKKNRLVGNYDFIPSGYEIEPADWLALSECVDLPMVYEVKGRIDGKEPNANRVSFGFNSGNGQIKFYVGKNQEKIVGYLLVNEDDLVVQEGINEILERLKVS